MTQIFKEDGTVVPVTVLSVGPCVVTQVKTREKDGYRAVQLGLGAKKGRAGKTVPRYVREVRDGGGAKVKVGEVIKLEDVFSTGDLVTVSGISKGKGFAGVVKRWGFHGGPKTHGQSDRHRAPGSIGDQRTARVYKGKRMAGRMGGEKVTVKGLEVMELDVEKHLMKVKGAVPGNRGGLVVIRKQ